MQQIHRDRVNLNWGVYVTGSILGAALGKTLAVASPSITGAFRALTFMISLLSYRIFAMIIVKVLYEESRPRLSLLRA
jgi:hypothetical protein